MAIDLENEFAPLHVVKRNIANFDRSVYRVYKTPSEFVSIEAATALEAFRESGVKNPLRIVREIRFMERMIDQSRFTDHEELVQTASDKPQTFLGTVESIFPASMEILDTSAEQPPATEGGDLSPEQVEALLNEEKAKE